VSRNSTQELLSNQFLPPSCSVPDLSIMVSAIIASSIVGSVIAVSVAVAIIAIVTGTAGVVATVIFSRNAKGLAL